MRRTRVYSLKRVKQLFRQADIAVYRGVRQALKREGIRPKYGSYYPADAVDAFIAMVKF